MIDIRGSWEKGRWELCSNSFVSLKLFWDKKLRKLHHVYQASFQCKDVDTEAQTVSFPII